MTTEEKIIYEKGRLQGALDVASGISDKIHELNAKIMDTTNWIEWETLRMVRHEIIEKLIQASDDRMDDLKSEVQE
jgi:hypothetical protein